MSDTRTAAVSWSRPIEVDGRLEGALTLPATDPSVELLTSALKQHEPVLFTFGMLTGLVDVLEQSSSSEPGMVTFMLRQRGE